MAVAILVLLILSAVMGLVLTIEVLRIVRKTTRTEKKITALAASRPAHLDNTFRQLEDLQALYHELSPRKALPRTRDWSASPDFLRVIMDQVRECRPGIILELGSGVSTIIAAYTLKSLGAGRILTLDHDQSYLATTAAAIRDHGLSEFVDLVHAPLVASSIDGKPWYSTENIPEGPIDMLIIDGPPANTAPIARFPAIPLLFDRLSVRARIVMDDSARNDEQECIVRWRRSYPQISERILGCEKGCSVLTRCGEVEVEVNEQKVA